MRCTTRKAPNFGASAVEYNLCRAADEEAHDPPHDVWREAVLAEKGMEPVMPQVVEGAGQIQEGSRGAAAAVEVKDLAARGFVP